MHICFVETIWKIIHYYKIYTIMYTVGFPEEEEPNLLIIAGLLETNH